MIVPKLIILLLGDILEELGLRYCLPFKRKPAGQQDE